MVYIKQVKGFWYKYSSYRDDKTGKPRTRYLGRASYGDIMLNFLKGRI